MPIQAFPTQPTLLGMPALFRPALFPQPSFDWLGMCGMVEQGRSDGWADCIYILIMIKVSKITKVTSQALYKKNIDVKEKKNKINESSDDL